MVDGVNLHRVVHKQRDGLDMSSDREQRCLGAHCVEANTGKPVWTHEINGEVWASPLVADGKVFLGTRSGTFYVFGATREKKLLSTIELGQPISATATAANGVLYVATMNRLLALQTAGH